MKNKGLIIIGLVVVAIIIIYVIWSNSKTKQLAAQTERDRQLAIMAAQQGQYASKTPWSTGIDSVGGLIDSLSGLFGKGGGSDAPATATNADAVVDHSENCMEMYPNDPVRQQNCMNAYPNYV